MSTIDLDKIDQALEVLEALESAKNNLKVPIYLATHNQDAVLTQAQEEPQRAPAFS